LNANEDTDHEDVILNNIEKRAAERNKINHARMVLEMLYHLARFI
jgi:hypothetical protein